MFTVIIPTYNRQNLLNECLQSLVNQSFKNFEVLVCDDGSTDSTCEVVSGYKDRLDIRYIRQINSGGPAAPRNLGIANAKYDWLCFLDSDDLWFPNKLQKLHDLLLYKDCKVICHPCVTINSTGAFGQTIGNYHRSFGSTDFETLLYNGGGVVNSSICVHKETLNNNIRFNTDQEFHGIEDFIFILNITYSGYKICTLRETLGFYRVHDGNLSADVLRQVRKWKIYFSSNPFESVNKNKLNSLFKYITLCNDSSILYTNKIKGFISLILFSSTTFRIRIKSIYHLFFSSL